MGRFAEARKIRRLRHPRSKNWTVEKPHKSLETQTSDNNDGTDRRKKEGGQSERESL